MKCRDLQDERYTLQTDSQELQVIAEHLGEDFQANEVTGALVAIGNDDYEEVWITSSSQPWSLSADYYRIFPITDWMPTPVAPGI